MGDWNMRVVVFSLVVAISLLVSGWPPNAVVTAQTLPAAPVLAPSTATPTNVATATAAPTAAPTPTPIAVTAAAAPAAPTSASAGTVDPDVQRQMTAAPSQLLPIIVELRPLPASALGTFP